MPDLPETSHPATAPDSAKATCVTTAHPVADKNIGRTHTADPYALKHDRERRRLLALRRQQRSEGDDDLQTTLALSRVSRQHRNLRRSRLDR
eukprot:4221027-Pyramimonas_sp.AAC.1